jgi:hypothetical protein
MRTNGDGPMLHKLRKMSLLCAPEGDHAAARSPPGPAGYKLEDYLLQGHKKMEPMRFELTTSCMPCKRSPN